MDVWFEALPTRLHAEQDELEAHLERLTPAAEAGATGFLVPEVEDGTIPAMDNLEFARLLHERTGLPVRIAVLTCSRTEQELHDRIEAAKAAGISGFLLVGPSHSDDPVRGPSVVEALGQIDAECGVVAIPHRNRRDRESTRLATKQAAGATFAVTQILFEEGEALRTTHNLRAKAGDGLQLLYSIAPARRPSDVRLLRRLGVIVPPALDLDHPGDVAERLAVETVRRLVADTNGPCGVCVSHVTYSNIEAAIDLVAAVRDVCLPLTV